MSAVCGMKPLAKIIATSLWGIGWVILPVQNVDAQQPCVQREWVGNGELSTRADGSLAVLSIDLVGGTCNVTPGSKPDGLHDFYFVIVNPGMTPRSLKGPVTLDMVREGIDLQFLEIGTGNGQGLTLLPAVTSGAPTKKGFRVIQVQRLIRVILGLNVDDKRSHASAAQRAFAQTNWAVAGRPK
jgi:hypothetical protein